MDMRFWLEQAEAEARALARRALVRELDEALAASEAEFCGMAMAEAA
jgi:hypothetical protein